jgi:hypothetical protein
MIRYGIIAKEGCRGWAFAASPASAQTTAF